MRIALQATSEGVLLPVRARAGAKQSGIGGVHNGALKVSVTQAPEKGKANRAILKLLAREFGLREGQLEIAQGATSSDKRVLVRGATLETVEACVKGID